MKTLREIQTPWAPYSVMFSSDGRRLAVGGGTWYGQGGVLIADLESERSLVTPLSELTPEPSPLFTASGVAWSGDDRHLAVCAWSSSHHSGPTWLCAVSDLALSSQHQWSPLWDPQGGLRDPCATGLVFSRESLIVRHNARAPEYVFAVLDVPAGVCTTDPDRDFLTSSRLIRIGDVLLSGGGGSLRLGGIDFVRGETFQSGRATGGIAAMDLSQVRPSYRGIATAGSERITAIAALPNKEGFLTGGLDGEIDIWRRFGGIWRSNPIRNKQVKSVHIKGLTWATYRPASIIGLCHLPDRRTWAAVDAVGEVTLWREERCVGRLQMPNIGSPRSLAAHPQEPILAVGLKCGGFGSPTSAVVLIQA